MLEYERNDLMLAMSGSRKIRAMLSFISYRGDFAFEHHIMDLHVEEMSSSKRLIFEDYG
jgi:hypothetical protein